MVTAWCECHHFWMPSVVDVVISECRQLWMLPIVDAVIWLAF